MGKRGSSAAASDSGPKRRHRTDESVVAQKLRDNFPELTPEETDVVRDAGGLTLRQRMARDLKIGKEQNIIYGRIYYDGLRAQFKKPTEAHILLEPADPTLPIAPDLIKAMLAAKSLKPDRSLFVGYMKSVEKPPNATEIAGIFRWLVTLKPTCVNKQLPVAMEALRFVARLSLHEVYPEQWTIVQPWADSVLCRTLASTRAQKTSDNLFKGLHRNLIELVLPSADLAALDEQPGGKWESKAAELTKVVASSCLGRALFEHCLHHVLSTRVQTEIVASIDATLAKKTKLTEAALLEAKRAAVKATDAIIGIGLMQAKRQIKVTYRGELITVKVASVTEEVDLRYSAAVKTLAVQQKILKKLVCEDLVVADLPCSHKATVDPALVKQAAAARGVVKHLLDDSAVSTADVLMKVIGSKTPALILTDPHFKVELGILGELSGDACEARFLSKIASCLPSAEQKDVLLETSLQQLYSLSASDAHKMAPREVQELLKHVRSMLSAILDGRPPDVQAAMLDDRLKNVVAAFQWFLASGEGSSTVWGTDAIREILKEAVAAHGKGQANLSHIAPLKIFHWLVPDDLHAEVTEIAAKVSAATQATMQGMKAKANDKDKEKNKEKDKAKDSAVKSAMDMFR